MKCIFSSPDSRESSTGSPEVTAGWLPTDKEPVWLHFEGEVDQPTLDRLQETFHLHPLALHDATRNRHPPKLEVFSDHTFLLFKALSHDAVTIDCSTIQLAMFVGQNFLVTISSGPSPSVKKLSDEIDKGSIPIEMSPDTVATRLIRFFVDRYLKILLIVEEKLENVEDGLLDRVDDAVLAEVTGYKSDLKKLRRIFVYHEQILRDMREKPHPGFGEHCKHYLNDVFEQQERSGSLSLLYYELASDLIEAYISLSSHRLNHIMKILTIVTSIFIPLGFLAGIYGMNFDHMPELHNKAGYYILLGCMASIALVLLFLFRIRKWI